MRVSAGLSVVLAYGCAAASEVPADADAGPMRADGGPMRADGGPMRADAGVDAEARADSEPSGDAGGADDTGAPDASRADGGVTGSRCDEALGTLTCVHESRLTRGRLIHWQVPLGDAPAGGWPAVVIFQPSIYAAELHWTGVAGGPFGQYYPADAIRTLLDGGFAVITPQAQALVGTVWETNLPGSADRWEFTSDDAMMRALFADLAAGVYGSIDTTALFATGMSSGGYMTSRMALSYPGRFRALAIQSGAWATCVGGLDSVSDAFGLATFHACHVPSTLPADHPPTLFIHGGADLIVPLWTMELYESALSEAGFETRKVLVRGGLHEFFSETPGELLAWFRAHLP